MADRLMDAAPSAQHQSLLLDLAEEAIRHQLQEGESLQPRALDYPAEFSQPGACFVTLERYGRLRGCIGSLQPRRPLLEDLCANALAAAFADPRFAPLREEELQGLSLHISLIGSASPMHCRNEADLLLQLQPGIDGLILEEGMHRATFLPSVWEQLPDPADFLERLRGKAGLPAGYWSDSMRFSRYPTHSFGRDLD